MGGSTSISVSTNHTGVVSNEKIIKEIDRQIDGWMNRWVDIYFIYLFWFYVLICA